MRSIKTRFNNISIKNPNLSSYICFAEAVKNQKFSKKMITIWFNKLVEKDDYSKNDKKELLKHLYLLSNIPEEGMKWNENPAQSLLSRGLVDIPIIKTIKA